ncbi:MAG: CYTH domain-containing protein [Spirochaetales bacterium]|nr:CYTH domain-containing protein [Spirochaetales bacterium]
MNTHTNEEIEIKCSLDALMYREILKLSPYRPVPVLQENHFFDTVKMYLLKKKWVLRLRIEPENAYLTTKGPEKLLDAVYKRIEYESGISRHKASALLAGFDLASIPETACRELVKRFGDRFVVPFLSFCNERIYIPWKSWRLEIDKTTINDSIFYELEAEAGNDDIDDLEAELREMFWKNGWQFRPSNMSKFKRALDIMGSEACGSV